MDCLFEFIIKECQEPVFIDKIIKFVFLTFIEKLKK